MINKYDSFIFDLDGTIYRGEHLIDKADQVVNTLKSLGKRIVFVSNKTTGTSKDYFNFLRTFNLNIKEDEVINSTFVLIKHLKSLSPASSFFTIGEISFINELEKEGFSYSTNPDSVETVIITLDRGVNFEKIEIAAKALENGARFYAANIDNTCPVENGEITDAGAVISILEKRTGRKLELNFGKPSSYMFEEAFNRLNTPKDRVLIIGDRLETDIAMGNIFNVDTALVKTGVKGLNGNSSGFTPTYNINSIYDILVEKIE
jgi:arabinose operon protein AraL